jgi:hydrogenase nickel incorporation protein HypA/HybF
MDEYHAAEVILRHVLQEAERSGARGIRSVKVALGDLSDLTEGGIASAWEGLSVGTAAAGAPIQFRRIAAQAQCMNCFRLYQPQAGVIHCPYCGSVGAKIISGEEFYVEALDNP